jgi:hypothetical protein
VSGEGTAASLILMSKKDVVSPVIDVKEMKLVYGPVPVPGAVMSAETTLPVVTSIVIVLIVPLPPTVPVCNVAETSNVMGFANAV